MHTHSKILSILHGIKISKLNGNIIWLNFLFYLIPYSIHKIGSSTIGVIVAVPHCHRLSQNGYLTFSSEWPTLYILKPADKIKILSAVTTKY